MGLLYLYLLVHVESQNSHGTNVLPSNSLFYCVNILELSCSLLPQFPFSIQHKMVHLVFLFLIHYFMPMPLQNN